MKQLCCRHSSGQLPVDVDVFAIDRITDSDLCGDCLRPLVHTTADGGVRMRIDQAGCDMKAAAVDDMCALGRSEVLSHLHHLAADHQQICIFDDSIGSTGPDGGIGDEHCRGREGAVLGAVGTQRHGELLIDGTLELRGIDLVAPSRRTISSTST